MEGDIGSYAWFIVVFGGTVVLGVALAIATYRWHKRRISRKQRREQEDKVDELYHREHTANPPGTR